MKTIVLVSHATNLKGPIDHLEDYCLSKKYTVYKIEHPLDNYIGRYSFLYKNKKLVRKIVRDRSKLNLFKDLLISGKFVLSIKASSFTIVGANNFDTFFGLTYKIFRTKKISKVIYFASDFSERRFKNIFLDSIYNLVEKFVLKRSTLVISNTKRAEDKRISMGLRKSKSIVIPNGVVLPKAKFQNKQISKNNFIYVGSVTKEHGIFDLVVEIEPLIKTLTIIGGGSDFPKLKRFLKTRDYKYTLFENKSNDFVMKYLQNFEGFGLAPYNSSSLWTYYCSPMKVNEYIASGVPVIMSSTPEISGVVKRNKLGIVYKNFNLRQLKIELLDFDTKGYCKRSKSFYSSYNYNSLYSKIRL